MSSLTRFLKSGQLIQLLGNPAVANPPTKIKGPVVGGNVGSIVRNLEKNVNPEIPGKNNSTVININKPIEGESDKVFAKRRAAESIKIANGGAFDSK